MNPRQNHYTANVPANLNPIALISSGTALTLGDFSFQSSGKLVSSSNGYRLNEPVATSVTSGTSLRNLTYGMALIGATALSYGESPYLKAVADSDRLNRFLAITSLDMPLSSTVFDINKEKYLAPVCSLSQQRRKRAAAMLRSWITGNDQDEVNQQTADFEETKVNLDQSRDSVRKLYS